MYVYRSISRHVVHEEQNARTRENPLVLKVKISVESDARWIYLIYSKRAEAAEYVEFCSKLLTNSYIYIYIYESH